MESANVRVVAQRLIVFILVAMGFPAHAQGSARPNVVIILVDDAALMDFGVYGGEARTPNIDALASVGALFTQYRTSPLCAPSRAMLLTGVDNHQTGLATIPEVLPEEQVGRPGYTMALEPDVLTLADRLRSSGYRTLMVGKWHLGETGGEMPQAHGFDRSFALGASGADNWEDRSYMPYYNEAPWFEDGREASLPGDFYSSRFIVDRIVTYLEETDASRPFFAYLAFQAIHIPVQAPREFIGNYSGRFDAGWHTLRTERHDRAQTLGLIPTGSPLAPMPEGSRDWRSLSENDRRLYAARMEVNAAMLEAMDFHVGRFVNYLRASRQFENTIFVVTSDNGPEPNRGDNDWRLSLWMRTNGYHTGLDGMGGRGSWGFIGPEWANAAASPGALYKFYATEGGVRAPLIIAGPGISRSRVSSPVMVTDIAPTLIEWLGAPAAPEDARAMTGRSLVPVLRGVAESAYAPGDVRVIEVSGNSALYQYDYKITRSMPPVGDGQWRLFNLAEDPGETADLSTRHPEVLESMLAEYAAYAARVGVLEMPAGYDSQRQVEQNSLKRSGGRLIMLGLATLGVLLVFLGGAWALRPRRAA